MNEFYQEPVTTDSEVGRIIISKEDNEQEVVEQNEIVEADLASKYLRLKEQLETIEHEKNRCLEAIRNSTNEYEKSKLANIYNECLAQARELNELIRKTKEEMKKQGWIFSQDETSGFKVELQIGRKGQKIFRISDGFGELPVKVGDAFLATLSTSISIPTPIRKKILDSFTFKGDEAHEFYLK